MPKLWFVEVSLHFVEPMAEFRRTCGDFGQRKLLLEKVYLKLIAEK